MPKSSKPNILVIWGDDIGISNLSCYSHRPEVVVVGCLVSTPTC